MVREMTTVYEQKIHGEGNDDSRERRNVNADAEYKTMTRWRKYERIDGGVRGQVMWTHPSKGKGMTKRIIPGGVGVSNIRSCVTIEYRT